MGLLGAESANYEKINPVESESTSPEEEGLGLKEKILAIFDSQDNIPEAIFQRLLGAIEVSGGTAEEIKSKVDGAVTELENGGLIKFDSITKEFSKVK